jgi:uncharacterized protein YjbI with pentapeptide repeats
MRERNLRIRPKPWSEERLAAGSGWTLPFRKINWWMAWLSWGLDRWALLDVLDHLGRFSVLIAVIFYFADSGNRQKQKHYQAWQVINTAQGKGGNGGRIDALQELNEDHVSLIGVDASGAYLGGVRLERAQLDRCDLHAADLRGSRLRWARLANSNLQSANFRGADLTGADLNSAELQDADLSGATLAKANLANADLNRADLRGADASAVNWQGIQSMKLANVYGMRNAPPEFLEFARKSGAVSLASDDEWNTLLRQAAADAK